MEDLERNRRNDSDVGEAERLSILERKKRAVLNTSAEPIPCLRKAFMTELAKEVIKDWRRPAAAPLRLAIPFWTFGRHQSYRRYFTA